MSMLKAKRLLIFSAYKPPAVSCRYSMCDLKFILSILQSNVEYILLSNLNIKDFLTGKLKYGRISS